MQAVGQSANMPLVWFTFDPAISVVLLGLATLYVRAVIVLGRRGFRVSRWQQVSWWSGLALMSVALMGPVGFYANRLMVSHMGEHLLIADLAAPLLLVGVRSPVLLFMPPRPVLVAIARRRWLRRAFAMLTKPPVAIAIYLIVLYGWHLRYPFQGALRSEFVHGLQHQSFVAISLLVWWSALEPQHRRLPGDLWKIGHITGVRLVSLFLGMALIFSRVPFYPDIYATTTQPYGLTTLEDQQLAGGLMMSLDILIIFFALCLFFWRAAADHDRRERADTERRSPDLRPDAG